MLALLAPYQGARSFHQTEVTYGFARRDSHGGWQHIELTEVRRRARIHLDKFILNAYPGHATDTGRPLHSRHHIVASGHLACLVTIPMEFELVRIILQLGTRRQRNTSLSHHRTTCRPINSRIRTANHIGQQFRLYLIE
ncbi:hypothetical protein D3C85_886720 [compost metagenome]